MLWYKYIAIICLFLFCPCTYAQLQITEIYPAPLSGEFEWIELVNTSQNPEQLSLYSLTDATGKKIDLPDTILAPDEVIIATSSSILNNTQETVTLSKGATQIETITYSGTFDQSKSLVRCGTEWITTSSISKGSVNTSPCHVLTPTVIPTPYFTVSPVPSQSLEPAISSTDLELSEFYPYPGSGEKEWVEFHNKTDTIMILENWYLDDVENGGSRPLQFTLEIPGLSFAAIELPSAILNNTSDTIRLLDHDQNEILTYSYTSGKKEFSFGKTGNGYCLQTPTKNGPNTNCNSAQKPTILPSPTEENTEQPNDGNSPSFSKSLTQPQTISSYQSIPEAVTHKGHDYILHVLPSLIPQTSIFIIRFFAACSIILSFALLLLLIARFKVRYTVL